MTNQRKRRRTVAAIAAAVGTASASFVLAAPANADTHSGISAHLDNSRGILTVVGDNRDNRITVGQRRRRIDQRQQRRRADSRDRGRPSTTSTSSASLGYGGNDALALDEATAPAGRAHVRRSGNDRPPWRLRRRPALLGGSGDDTLIGRAAPTRCSATAATTA
jgi:hypothetical protein